MTETISWLILLVQVPSEPSRHRVAVWRQLRKIGAAPLMPGTWVLPDSPRFADGVQRAARISREAGGTFLAIAAMPTDALSRATMEETFLEARREEWREFLSDCQKLEREIAKEISIEKFTYAELEEEDQSMERLRRWYRELKKRDVLQLPEAQDAQQAVQRCTDALEHYAHLVYAAGNEIDS